MSVEHSNATSAPSDDTIASPVRRMSANYMSCRHCGEGSLVFDPEIEDSRCRACGKRD